jgi:hypothetical protein
VISIDFEICLNMTKQGYKTRTPDNVVMEDRPVPRIERAQPTTGPSPKGAAAPSAPVEATPGPAQAPQEQDRIQISVDARVKLGADKKPEVVLEDVEVNGIDVNSQVERNMAGRRSGLRERVTAQVAKAIADQVALALVPVLEDKLEGALTAEGLPPSLSDELAKKTVPELSRLIAQHLAEQAAAQAKISYKLGF